MRQGACLWDGCIGRHIDCNKNIKLMVFCISWKIEASDLNDILIKEKQKQKNSTHINAFWSKMKLNMR